MPILNWLGKDKVINHHQQVPYRVLEPQYTYGQADSAGNPGGGNMLIHGDNLDALKSLLPHFEGKVKCIYIDPPYNTGNENWVYNDNVNDPKIKKWLGEVVGREGEDLSRHDKWICMMYPRLMLLKRLLANEGFVFVSIDVFEFAHLKILMDEIFGTQNFRNCIAVRRGIKNVQAQFEEVSALSLGHEYIFLYSKSAESKLPKLSVQHANEKPGKWDTFWRGTDRPTMRYELFGHHPETGQWRWESNRANRAIRNYEEYMTIYSQQLTLDDYYIDHLMSTNEKLDFVRKNESEVIQYYVPPQSGKLLSDNWMDILLAGSYSDFDTEKNVTLIERIVSWIAKPNDIVLDSFAGSGTTAHAVLNMNKQDGGDRKFILVEMMDYAESITAERVRRVIDGYGNTEGTGGGFAYYELGERLLFEDGNLNESLDAEKIREYVWYTETRTDYLPQEEQYLLGVRANMAYYFYYEKDRVTVLDHDFLHGVKTQASSYLIYADINALSAEEMDTANIHFKKIPRDITRL